MTTRKQGQEGMMDIYTPDEPTYPLSYTDLQSLDLYADDLIALQDMTPNARAVIVSDRRRLAEDPQS